MSSNKFRSKSFTAVPAGAFAAALLLSSCGGQDSASPDSDAQQTEAFDSTPDDLAFADDDGANSASNESSDYDGAESDGAGNDDGEGDVVTTGEGSDSADTPTSTISANGSTTTDESTAGSSGTDSATSSTANGSSTSGTATTGTATTSPSTSNSSTSQTSTSAAKTTPITTSTIDCISGQFTFAFSDPNNAGQITAINVLRDGVQDETLTETSDGVYRAQIKNSTEVVTAEVEYTAGGATLTHTHPLADCSQIMGGQYKICNGEGIHTAYPASWFSQQDIEGPGFCGYFRSVAQDGYFDHEITRKGFSGQSMSQVVTAYENDPTFKTSTAQSSIGTLLARPGYILDFGANQSDPNEITTRVYLFESGGNVQEIRADQVHSGTDSFAVLAAMMDTLTLFEQ